MMIVSLYTTGRKEEYFPNPTKFWPERWTRPTSGNCLAVNNPNACLPFAIGARSCIGRKVAEAQMSMALASVSLIEISKMKNCITLLYSLIQKIILSKIFPSQFL